MKSYEKEALKQILYSKLDELKTEREQLNIEYTSTVETKRNHYKEHQDVILMCNSNLTDEITDEYIKSIWDDYKTEYDTLHEEESSYYTNIDLTISQKQSKLTEIESNINTIVDYIDNNLV